MKSCPKCGRVYQDETLNFCLEDGEWLTAERISVEPQTAVLPDHSQARTESFDEKETRIYTSGPFASKEFRSSRFGALLIVGLIGVVLAGFAYGLYRFLGDKSVPMPERPPVSINTQRLTGDGKARGAEISPDGKFLAYIRAEGGNRSIWLKQIQTGSNIEIVKPAGIDVFEGLAFSPDGNFLYFNASTAESALPSIYRVPTLGGSPVKVLTNAFRVQFSPDGKQISFGRYLAQANESTIYVANADGSNERKLASRTGTFFFNSTPAWSPDSTKIAISAGDDSLSPKPSESLVLITVADGTVTQLGETLWFRISDIVWHPSGDSLITIATDSTGLPEQVWELSYPGGKARRITNNLNGYGTISITADGKSLVTGEVISRSAVWVSPDLKPENAKPVMPATADTWGFSWTPDGRIVMASEQSGEPEIWIMDADGSNGRPLTSNKKFKTLPVVSPDGKYIVYSEFGTLVRINIDGSNPLIFDQVPGADNPDVSHDSKWIIYSAWIDGIQRIVRIPIDGGEPQILTKARATEPRYSTDGSRFACFVQNESTNDYDQLAIFPAEGGEPLKTLPIHPNANVGRGPVWTPDDQGITLVVSPGELQNLWLQPIAGGAAKQMTNFGIPGVARRQYSRDGKRIALVRAEGIGNAIMISDFR